MNGAIGDALGRLKLVAEAGGFRLAWTEEGENLDCILWPIACSLSYLLAETAAKVKRLGLTESWALMCRNLAALVGARRVAATTGARGEKGVNP